jgi:hypothetical protein
MNFLLCWPQDGSKLDFLASLVQFYAFTSDINFFIPKKIDFLSIFGRFWLPSWSQVEAKLDQKSIKKGMQNDIPKSMVQNPCKKKTGAAGQGGWVP